MNHQRVAGTHATFLASATSNIQVKTKDKCYDEETDLIQQQDDWRSLWGGLAEYFDLDPTLFRVLYAIATVFTAFSGVILYLVLWMIIPKK